MGKDRTIDYRQRGARGAILGLLRGGDSTVARIADEVGLTRNGVRLHLDRLTAEGLVEQVGSQPGQTKSSRLYGLSAAGRRMYSHAYAAFLGALVAELAERDARRATGPPAGDVRELFTAVARRLATPPPDADRQARLERALDGLRALGAQPVVETTAAATAIALPQCPLSDLSSAHAEVCEFARALVAGWTGEPVAIRCTRGDRPRCRFELAGS